MLYHFRILENAEIEFPFLIFIVDKDICAATPSHFSKGQAYFDPVTVICPPEGESNK